jgi:hypothetical protein
MRSSATIDYKFIQKYHRQCEKYMVSSLLRFSKINSYKGGKMKRLSIILTMGFIGLLLFIPISINAQDVKPLDQTNASKLKSTIVVGPKLMKKKVTKPIKNSKDLNNHEELYHIVVLTKGHKKESLWVELKPGEQKYITIRLDNGTSKDVSILLNDKKQSMPIKFGPYDRSSRLTLQPISF